MTTEIFSSYQIVRSCSWLSFVSLHCVSTLFFALFSFERLYSSVACSSTNAVKVENIQCKFVALCHSRFFSQIRYECFTSLKCHTLYMRMKLLELLCLINIYSGFKF
jgi:hypothetical protein